VAALLKAGARIDARVPRDEWGENKHYKKSALELARAEGYSQIIELLQAAGATVPPKPKRRRKPDAVADSWRRIARWIKDQAPGWKPLKKGASEEQIKRVEKKLRFELPTDFRDSYRIHNGSGSEQIFPCPDDISYYWMSISEMGQDWQMMKELLEGGEFVGRQAQSERGIRADWWHVGWLPFASNGGGDYFCIDHAPAAGGKQGQIITMNHESGEHKLLAPSLREWLYRFANDLEDGIFTYEEGEGIV
jgi:cell wall assembly regulator SMI1